MTAIKTLWASVQGDPKLMRRINGWLTLFWVAMIPVSMVMGWLSSVVYVSALSLWALVSGHWSAWQAARVEVNQQRVEEEAAQVDLPAEVADAVLARTAHLPPAPPDPGPHDSGATSGQRVTEVIDAARDLIADRCHLDAEQASRYLANYAQLADATLGVAAQQLLQLTAPVPTDPGRHEMSRLDVVPSTRSADRLAYQKEGSS